MTSIEKPWTQDPLQLIRFDKLLSFFPRSDASDAEAFNAVTRSVLLATGLSYYFKKSRRDLLFGIGTLVVADLLLSMRKYRTESLSAEETTATPTTDTPTTTAAPLTTTPAVLPVTRKAALAAMEDVEVPPDTPIPSSEMLLKRADLINATPQGVVKIHRTTDVPAYKGVASAPARISNLRMQPGESFPGQKAAMERLTWRGEVPHRSQIIPSDQEIHAAYRPVPAQWPSRADDDYMNGFVGPYKRIGRLV